MYRIRCPIAAHQVTLAGSPGGSFSGGPGRTLLPPEFSRGYTRIFTPRAFFRGILIYRFDFSGGMPQLFPARFSGADYLLPAFSVAPMLLPSAPVRSTARLPPAGRDLARTVFHRSGDNRTEICRSCPPTQGQRRPSSGRPTALRPDHRRHHLRDRPSSGNRNQLRNLARKSGRNRRGSGIENGNGN